MTVSVVVELEVIDVDHQERQFAAVLLGLHPFEIEPALEAAPVGKTRQHVDRGDDGEAVIGGDQLALALAELGRHRVEGARQRYEFRRQAVAHRARRPVALTEALGHVRQHVDRLNDQLFGGDQRAEQDEQADEEELQICSADVAVDRRGDFVLVDAGDQARASVGDPRKSDGASRTVGGDKGQ